MPYLNTSTQSFGHSHGDVSATYPNSSIPNGVSHEEFLWYEPSEPPAPSLLQSLIEIEPAAVDGKLTQRWRLDSVAPAEAVIRLANAKLDKNQEINASRLAANSSTFSHGGKAFACDALSRGDIDGTNGFVTLYGSLPPGWPGGWKAIDNSYLQISSVDEWKAFYASMFAAGAANFAKAQSLKAQLASATTPEQVAAITW